MQYRESPQQILFVRWFKVHHPEFQKLIASFANGQNVGPFVGQRLKDMGMLKGMTDLAIFIPCAPYHGLLIEMKGKGGRVSPEQKEIHEGLRAQGYKVGVAYSAEDARKEWFDYFQPAISAD